MASSVDGSAPHRQLINEGHGTAQRDNVKTFQVATSTMDASDNWMNEVSLDH